MSVYPLTKLKSRIKVFNINSFDIETHGKDNLFYLGGFYSDKYYKFYSKEHLDSFMVNNVKKNTKVYATNLHFDWNAVYDRFKDKKESSIIMKGGRFMSVRFHGIEFGDTLSYTMTSVKKLGEMLGLPKLKHPKCLGKIPKNPYQKKELERYNRMDCLITKTFTEQFQKVLNELGGELKITIASCSMDLYRRKYIPFQIWKEYPKYFQDDTKVKDFIFSAYYGGRTECFKIGNYLRVGCKDKYYLYDVNSLYPSVMLNKYPLPSSCRISNFPNEKNIIKYEGVSNVTIECPYMDYPLLPYRTKEKLLFPYGKLRKQSYNHIELRKALQLGYKIIKIHKQIYYTKTFYPFKKWVTELYALRLKYQLEGNEIYSTIVKILMNSLYGKFGMKNVSEFSFNDLDFDRPELQGTLLLEGGECDYSETPIECNQPYVIPILASYTTSFARLVLYDHLVDLEGIYCDTDSIITKRVIETSKELGKLKLEKEFYKFCIVKPKHYYIKDVNGKEYFKVKGIRLSDKNPMKDFNNSITGVRIKQTGFRKLKESMRTRTRVNSKKTFYKVQNIVDTKRDWDNKLREGILTNSHPIKLI